MHEMFNLVGEEMRAGNVFADGTSSQEVLKGYPVAFKVVRTQHYDEYLGQAQQFYQDEEFPVLQMFWPDASARFPYQKGVSPQAKIQPLLF